MRTNDIFFVKPLISVFIHLFSINISRAVEEALRKTDKDHCPWSFRPTQGRKRKSVCIGCQMVEQGWGYRLIEWSRREASLGGWYLSRDLKLETLPSSLTFFRHPLCSIAAGTVLAAGGGGRSKAPWEHTGMCLCMHTLTTLSSILSHVA